LIGGEGHLPARDHRGVKLTDATSKGAKLRRFDPPFNLALKPLKGSSQRLNDLGLR